MMNRMTSVAAACVAMLSAAPAVMAQPLHIFLTEEGGNLQSNLWVDNNPMVDGPENRDGGDVFKGVRAFAEQMGGIPGFGPQGAGQSIHPGLFGEIEGITVGVELVDTLRRWDGSDFDDVSGDEFGENRMQLSGFTTPFGDDPLNPVIFTTPNSELGAPLILDDEWIVAGDEIDEHIQYTITDNAGVPLTETEAEALSEIFLVSIRFTSPTLGSTDTVFITLSQGASDDELARAQAYVQNVLVPAPGGAALFGLTLLAARRRRA